MSNAITPSFWQRHETAILATSALVAVVSAIAIGFFASQGHAAFLPPGIPLCLTAGTATTLYIATLLKKWLTPPPPPNQAKAPPPPNQTKAPPPPNLIEVPPTETPPLPASPDSQRFYTAQMPFTKVVAVEAKIKQLRSNCLTSIFDGNKRLNKAFLDLYKKTYTSNATQKEVQNKMTNINRALDAYQTELFKKLDEIPFFIWLGIDSAYDADTDVLAFRTGKKTYPELQALLQKYRVNASATEAFDRWLSAIGLPKESTFKPQNQTALLIAYEDLEETDKVAIASELCTMIKKRFDSNSLMRWKSVAVHITSKTSESTAATQKIGSWELVLKESSISTQKAAQVEQMEEVRKGGPLEEFTQYPVTVLENVFIVVICAMNRSGKFYLCMKELVPKLNDKQDFLKLVNSFENAAQPLLK